MKEHKDNKTSLSIVVKCPKCGHKISVRSVAAKMGAKGGRVSSEAKSAAAKAREERKRKERGEDNKPELTDAEIKKRLVRQLRGKAGMKDNTGETITQRDINEQREIIHAKSLVRALNKLIK